MKSLFCAAVFVLLAAAMGFAGDQNAPATEPTHSHHPTNTVATWSTVVIRPAPRETPIRFRDRVNPCWWPFNCDEPIPPADFKPHDRERKLKWWIRNPFHNFVFYAVGFNDRVTHRSGRAPEQVFLPDGGWNLAVTRYRVFYFPFVSYRGARLQTYLGWRPHGNFGIKLNVRSKKH